MSSSPATNKANLFPITDSLYFFYTVSSGARGIAANEIFDYHEYYIYIMQKLKVTEMRNLLCFTLSLCVLQWIIGPGLYAANAQTDVLIYNENTYKTEWTNLGLAFEEIRSVAVTNSGSIYAGTNHGLYRSENNGAAWEKIISTNDIIYSVAIPADNQEIIYAGTGTGELWLSDNRGGNWEHIQLAQSPLRSIYIHPENYEIFVSSSFEGLYRGSQSFTQWDNIGLTDVSILDIAVSYEDPQVIYAATTSGVYKTMNGGSDWRILPIGLSHDYVQTIAVQAFDTYTVLAGTKGGGIFKSVVGGDEWYAHNVGLENKFIRRVALSKHYPYLAYCGTFGSGIYRTLNMGRSWEPVPVDARIILALTFSPSDDGTLFVGTAHNGLYKGKIDPTELVTEYSLQQNFPNPFNVSSQFAYTIPDAGAVKIGLYSILGQEIATLVDADVHAGTHTVVVNSRDLASGVYYYTLQTPKFTQTRKLIVLK